jgi:hypothetical protein
MNVFRIRTYLFVAIKLICREYILIEYATLNDD